MLKKILQKIFCIGLLLGISTGSAFAMPSAKESPAVDHLLEFVRNSDYTFSCDGENFNGKQAADYFAKNYDEHMSQIFTAADFIERAASKNVITGKRYTLKRPDGTEGDVKNWLATELRKYQEIHPQFHPL